jgi:AcrR family transcriptional regulator
MSSDATPLSAPAPRASSRNALIEAALDEFSELGYEAATVAGIAERAGVTTGALYAHFDGKLDLLIEAIGLASPSDYVQSMFRTFSMSLSEVAQSLQRDVLPQDRRRLLLLDVIVVARRDPDVAKTLRRGFDAYVATIQRATEEGINGGLIDPVLDAGDLARFGAIISLGLLVIEALDEQPPNATALAQLTDLLFRGRGAGSGGEPAALARVRSRAAVAEQARQRLHDAIAAAARDGHSLRQIGAAAGVSHERVRRIVNDQPADRN